MRTHHRNPHQLRSLPSIYLLGLYFAVQIQQVLSVLHPLSTGQSSFAALQLPLCALLCFVNGILTDGCASDTDCACHCTTGNILWKTTACVEQSCSEEEKNDAYVKIRAACGDGQWRCCKRWRSAVEWRAFGARHSCNERWSDSDFLSNRCFCFESAISAQFKSQCIPEYTDNKSFPATQLFLDSQHHSCRVTYQDAPRSPSSFRPDLSQERKQVSHSVSPSSLSLSSSPWGSTSAAAQAVAGLPKTNLISTVSTRGRRDRESPVNPLSPRSMREVSLTEYNALKKKRGHVLSVVVERIEKARSSMRKPVPGQRERISEPLEVDGGWVARVELPVARDRSTERK